MQDTIKRLEALSSYDILDTPAEPEFDDIVQIAQRVCEVPVALVSLVAHDRQWFKAKIGFDACETPLGQSVCVHALEADDLLVIRDLTGDPRTASNALVTGPPHIRFYAGAPLRTPEGVAIGSLCVIDDRPRPQGLTAPQIDTLRALARQTMIVLALRKTMAAQAAALNEEKRARLVGLMREADSQAAHDRLRDAEALVRGAQEAARIGAFEVDIASNRFQVTAAFCRLFGMPDQPSFAARELEDCILLPDRAVASTRVTRDDASAVADVEYRIRRGNDGALRWISRRSAFVFDEAGEPVRMLGVIQDITERKLIDLRARAVIELGDRLRSASTTREAARCAAQLLGETLAASRTGYAIVDDANGSFVVEDDWTAPGVASIVGRVSTATFAATIANLRQGTPLAVANIPAAPWLAADGAGYAKIATAAQIKVPLVQHGTLVGVLFVHNATPRTWSSGEIDFAMSIADRIYAAIAKIMAEDHQRVLNEELSHRLKNTLAMVQAIATQTLRGITERDVVEALEQRIITLSKAHDVLLQQSWSTASVSAVSAKVLELSGRGADIRLKYGALSVEAGRVDFAWRVDYEGSEPVVAVEWVESGGPPASPPRKRGFGSRLIGMGLAGAGNAKLDYTQEGLRAWFRAPLRSVAKL